MRHRPALSAPMWTGKNPNNSAHENTNGNIIRKWNTDEPQSRSYPALKVGTVFVVLILWTMLTLQLLLNSLLHSPSGSKFPVHNLLRNPSQPSPEDMIVLASNSYDTLLKNTIDYSNKRVDGVRNNESESLSVLQMEINNLRSQIQSLESKSQQYVDDPRFFPFIIRDSRHLTPVQVDPDFHVFDYVDLTQAKQPKSQHSQLLHNARIVIDDELEAKRASHKIRMRKNAEKYEAPCQKYSVECYRQKILQVFSYVLRQFPSVEYYFYVEADNDLCVPMSMVKDLALKEQRYFINTGIGFSGWIMSRAFLKDFLGIYGNTTIDDALQSATKEKRLTPVNSTAPTHSVEIRPDVLASYYLTDKQAWTVTRQYWVSHTTLESLGVASLTVKDRRKENTGERMKLDKHLPRCLEPRRGKWKVSRRKPYLDPRDRFGWDYFDYDVCPNELLFPCGGPDQLKELIAQDWKIANETGALAKWKQQEEANRKREERKRKVQAAKNARNEGRPANNSGNNDAGTTPRKTVSQLLAGRAAKLKDE